MLHPIAPGMDTDFNPAGEVLTRLVPGRKESQRPLEITGVGGASGRGGATVWGDVNHLLGGGNCGQEERGAEKRSGLDGGLHGVLWEQTGTR